MHPVGSFEACGLGLQTPICMLLAFHCANDFGSRLDQIVFSDAVFSFPPLQLLLLLLLGGDYFREGFPLSSSYLEIASSKEPQLNLNMVLRIRDCHTEMVALLGYQTQYVHLSANSDVNMVRALVQWQVPHVMGAGNPSEKL